MGLDHIYFLLGIMDLYLYVWFFISKILYIILHKKMEIWLNGTGPSYNRNNDKERTVAVGHASE